MKEISALLTAALQAFLVAIATMKIKLARSAKCNRRENRWHRMELELIMMIVLEKRVNWENDSHQHASQRRDRRC